MPTRPFLRFGGLRRLGALTMVAGLLCLAGQASFHAPRAQAPAGGKPPTYVVKAGDSLWAIARTYRVTVAQLASTNAMHPSDVLVIGRHLKIPGVTSPSTPSTHSASAPGSRPGTPAAASAGGPPADRNFCNTFTPTAGPRHVLPAGLQGQPARMALRPLFVHWSKQYGVAPALAEAIAWQESGWQVGVVSSAQAVGVGQLLPSTADFVSHQLLGQTLDINSASDNIRMSARYLAYLQGQEGSVCRTVAAYYEGSVNMSHYGVFLETEPYVASVEALMPRFE